MYKPTTSCTCFSDKASSNPHLARCVDALQPGEPPMWMKDSQLRIRTAGQRSVM
jgi:hypothetical protein